MVEFLAGASALTWLVTEVLGKFVFAKMDKKVLAVIVGALTGISAGFTGYVDATTAAGLSLTLGPAVGVIHDKLLGPVLIAGKNELSK